MTKYYRRAGTIAYRYIIQAEIEKIELKVPTAGPYPQRYSVILKRGIQAFWIKISWHF